MLVESGQATLERPMRGADALWVLTRGATSQDLKQAMDEHFTILDAAFSDLALQRTWIKLPEDAIYATLTAHYENAHVRYLNRVSIGIGL